MNLIETLARIVAVIGTAGRDFTKTMTLQLWEAMVADLRQRLSPTDTLVSGGAAWADHLAVYAYLQGWCAGLILHLPAPFENGQFVGPVKGAGWAANYYHEVFRQVTGIDGLAQITQAITKGCTVTDEPASAGYAGMFVRNKKVAQIATACIAYTFGEGNTPADGGTLNTWDQIVSADKQHVCLTTLALSATALSQEPIFFSKTKGAYGEFSNFYPSPLLGGGKVWPTVEHLYQAQKFTDPLIREKIRLLPNPMAAAIEGRNPANVLRPDWEQVKEHKMLGCLHLKFSQHPALAQVLRETGDRLLVELSYKDPYWGSKPDLSGQNRLGQLLMRLRYEFSLTSKIG